MNKTNKIQKWIKKRKKSLYTETALCVLLATVVGLQTAHFDNTKVEASGEYSEDTKWLSQHFGAQGNDSNGNYYKIDSIEDFFALQEYSKNHTCKGLYFKVDQTVLEGNYHLYVLDAKTSQPTSSYKDANNKIKVENTNIGDSEGQQSNNKGVQYHVDLVKYADPYYIWANDLDKYTWRNVSISLNNDNRFIVNGKEAKEIFIDNDKYGIATTMTNRYELYTYAQSQFYVRKTNNNSYTENVMDKNENNQYIEEKDESTAGVWTEWDESSSNTQEKTTEEYKSTDVSNSTEVVDSQYYNVTTETKEYSVTMQFDTNYSRSRTKTDTLTKHYEDVNTLITKKETNTDISGIINDVQYSKTYGKVTYNHKITYAATVTTKPYTRTTTTVYTQRDSKRVNNKKSITKKVITTTKKDDLNQPVGEPVIVTEYYVENKKYNSPEEAFSSISEYQKTTVSDYKVTGDNDKTNVTTNPTTGDKQYGDTTTDTSQPPSSFNDSYVDSVTPVTCYTSIYENGQYFRMSKGSVTSPALSITDTHEIDGSEVKHLIRNGSTPVTEKGYFKEGDYEEKYYSDNVYIYKDHNRVEFNPANQSEGTIIKVFNDKAGVNKYEYYQNISGSWILVKPSVLYFNKNSGLIYKSDVLDYAKPAVTLEYKSVYVNGTEYKLAEQAGTYSYVDSNSSPLTIGKDTIIEVRQKSYDSAIARETDTSSISRYFKYFGNDQQFNEEEIHEFREVKLDESGNIVNENEVLFEKDEVVTYTGNNVQTDTPPVWYGIGMNPEFPFEGRIDFCGLKVRTDTNIFGFLADGAQVINLSVFGEITHNKNQSYYTTNNIQSGNGYDTISLGSIASNVLLQKTENATDGAKVTIRNCTVISAQKHNDSTGSSYVMSSVKNSTKGSVGGIVGTVISQYGNNHCSESKPNKLEIDTCNVQADVRNDKGAKYSITNSNANIQKITKDRIFSASYNVGYTGGVIGSVCTVYNNSSSDNHEYEYVEIKFIGNNLIATTPKNINKNTSVNGLYSSESYVGGLVGFIGNCVSVEIDGSVKFSNDNYETPYIWSGQDSSTTTHDHTQCKTGLLIADALYTSVSMLPSTQLETTTELDAAMMEYVAHGTLNESSNIYVNLSNDRKNNVINGQGTAENPYLLENTADFVTLARYFSSKGYIGTGSFNTPSIEGKDFTKVADKFEYVQRAVFKIKPDSNCQNYTIVVDSTDTGIFSINRNADMAFKGKMYGEKQGDTYPTISYSVSNAHEDDIAFLRYVMVDEDNVEFNNFNITGSITYDYQFRNIASGLIKKLIQKTGDKKIIMANIDNSLNVTSYCSSTAAFISEYDYTGITLNGNKTVADFSYLTVSGNIGQSYYWSENYIAAGLIGYLKDKDVSNSEYYTQIDISNFCLKGKINSKYGSAAGLIGYNTKKTGTSQSIEISNQKGDKCNVSRTEYKNRLHLNITNFSAGKTDGTGFEEAKVSAEYYSGMIAAKLYNVECIIAGVNLNHATTAAQNTSTNRERNVGALIGYTYASNYDIKKLRYDSFYLDANPRLAASAIFGYVDTNCYIDVDLSTQAADETNYSSFTNCKVDTKEYNPVAAVAEKQNGNRVEYAAINIKGSYKEGENTYKYSPKKFYKYKFGYVENNSVTQDYKGFTGASARFHYNIYPQKDATEEQRAKYNIKGSGTDSNPFIIDNPEQLVILDCMLEINTSNMDKYLSYFTDLTSGNNLSKLSSILCGYYLFSKDIDLNDYSFYPLQIYGGQYFGCKLDSLNIDGRNLTKKNVIDTLLDDTNVHVNVSDRLTGRYETAYSVAVEELKANTSGSADPYTPKAPNFNETEISKVEGQMVTDGKTQLVTDFHNLNAIRDNKPTVKFNASSVHTAASDYKYASPVSNDDDTSLATEPARNMHSGMFCNIVGGNSNTYQNNFVYIDNFKLEGSISGTSNNNSTTSASVDTNASTYGNTVTRKDSGALITFTGCKYYYANSDHSLVINNYQSYAIKNANVNIYNIDIGNLSVMSSGEGNVNEYKVNSKTINSGTGALIDTIYSSGSGYAAKVYIDGIKTVKEASGNGLEGCASLIGYQNQATGGNASIEFYNINMNSVYYKAGRETTHECGCEDNNNKISITNHDHDFNSKTQIQSLFYYNFAGGAAVYWYTPGDYDDVAILWPDEFTPASQNTHGKHTTVPESFTLNDAAHGLTVQRNPSNFNIEHGSGTVTDPYVIESEGQLLTLYAMLANQSTATIHKDEWFVGEINDTPGYISNDPTTWPNNNKITWTKGETLQSTNLENYNYLKNAYYAIVYNLDLSSKKGASEQEELKNATFTFTKADGNSLTLNENDVNLLKSNYLSADYNYLLFQSRINGFDGLGSDTTPFNGCIDGGYVLRAEQQADGHVKKFAVKAKGISHTICLPNYKGGQEYSESSYGFINSTYGTKVANLGIENCKTDVNYNYINVRYNTVQSYGTVIGTILGGDTIIDNVTVKGGVAITSFTIDNNANKVASNLENDESRGLGAIIGTVEAGSVTFTNMSHDAVSDFDLYTYSYDENYSAGPKQKLYDTLTGSPTDEQKSKEVSKYIGGYVGKIGKDADKNIDLPHVMIWFDGMTDGTYDRYVCVDNAKFNGHTLTKFPYRSYSNQNTDTVVYETNNYIMPLRYTDDDSSSNLKYSIFNREYFEGVYIPVKKNNSVINVEITGAKQFYLLSLALNSGVLSTNIGENTYKTTNNKAIEEYKNYPYNYYCSNYKLNSDDSSNKLPAMLQYYFTLPGNIDDIYYTYGTKKFCRLNQIYDHEINNTVYKIMNNLDMSNIGNFAGLGLRDAYLTYQGNTYTSGSTTVEGTYNYIYSFLESIQGELTNGVAPTITLNLDDNSANQALGLINNMYHVGNWTSGCNMYGYTSEYKDNNKNDSIKISNLILSGSIKLDNNSSTNSSYAGALVGLSDSTVNYYVENVTVKDFEITSNSKGAIGGLVGRANKSDSNLTIKNLTIGEDKANNNSYNSAYTNYSVKLKTTANTEYVGGVYGYAPKIRLEECNVVNTYINANTSAYEGGVVGYYNIATNDSYMIDIDVQRTRIIANNNSLYQGGMIGRVNFGNNYEYARTLAVKNVNMLDNYIYNTSETDTNKLTAQIVGLIGGPENKDFQRYGGFTLIKYTSGYSENYKTSIPTNDPHKSVIDSVIAFKQTALKDKYDYYIDMNTDPKKTNYNTYGAKQDDFNLGSKRSRTFIYQGNNKSFVDFATIENSTIQQTSDDDSKFGIEKYVENNKNKQISSEGTGSDTGNSSSGTDTSTDTTLYKNYTKFVATDTSATSSPNIVTPYVFGQKKTQDGRDYIDGYNLIPNDILNYTNISESSNHTWNQSEAKGKYMVSWSSEINMYDVIQDLLITMTDGQGVIDQTHNTTTVKKYSNIDYNWGWTDDYIEITVKPMKINPNGTIQENGDKRLFKSYINKDKNLDFMIAGAIDSVSKTEDNNTYGTYSLLMIRYVTRSGYDNDHSSKTGLASDYIIIPFMVNNKIDVDIYKEVAVGEYYDDTEMRKLRNENLSITKDSSFTLYEELTYSDTRKAFDTSQIELYYPKAFVLNNAENIVIPGGTRLTLVDMTEVVSDNTDKKYKTYFYKVPENNTSNSVLLTDFKDDDGNSFKERIISKKGNYSTELKAQDITSMYTNYPKKNVGVERFLIFVDVSDIKQKTQEDSISSGGSVLQNQTNWLPEIIYSDVAAKSPSYSGTGKTADSSIFSTISRCFTNVTTYSGRTIKFDEAEATVNKKLISKTSQVTVNKTYSITADNAYWTKVKSAEGLRDYANQTKFLEIAISLVDADGNKVLLPQGTRIKFENETNYNSISSTSSVYYYKDGAKLKKLYKDGLEPPVNTENSQGEGASNSNTYKYEDNYFYANITTEDEGSATKTDGFRLENMKGDLINIPINFTLDFQYAKLETLASTDYKLCLEIVRSKNKDYPMGSEVLDKCTIEGFKVSGNSNYGLSVTPGTTYTGSATTEVHKDDVSFNKLDSIKGKVDTTTNDITFKYTISMTSGYSVELAKGKNVYLMYCLKQKNPSTGTYDYCNSDQLGVTINVDPEGIKKIRQFMPYSQIVGLNGITELSGVDLTGSKKTVGNEQINTPIVKFSTVFNKFLNNTSTGNIKNGNGYSIKIENVPVVDETVRIPFSITMPKNKAANVNYKLEVMLYSEDDLKSKLTSGVDSANDTTWMDTQVKDIIGQSTYYTCYDYVIFNVSNIDLDK